MWPDLPLWLDRCSEEAYENFIHKYGFDALEDLKQWTAHLKSKRQYHVLPSIFEKRESGFRQLNVLVKKVMRDITTQSWLAEIGNKPINKLERYQWIKSYILQLPAHVLDQKTRETYQKELVDLEIYLFQNNVLEKK